MAQPTVVPCLIEPESDEEESNNVYTPFKILPVSLLKINHLHKLPISPAPASMQTSTSTSAKKHLMLLNSIFGEANEWGGPESVREFDGMDGDRTAMVVDTDPSLGTVSEGKIEEVPPHASTGEGEARMNAVRGVPSSEERWNSVEDILLGDTHPTAVHLSATATATNARTATSETDATTAAAPTRTRLKDLFTPREEEPSFSLLSRLGLDLELEDDVFGGSSISTTTLPSMHVAMTSSGPTSDLSSKHQVRSLRLLV